MQRNSKQVLLKYNIVERKTIEDDALMIKIKTSLRWFILTVLLLLLFMFYVPLYIGDCVPKDSVDVILDGWGPNISRSIPLYINPDKETALIDGSHLCSEPLTLLVIICSAVSNTRERVAIRETWGNFSSYDYKLVFLLGTTDNTTLQEAIEEESATYNDLIQENFFDSYNNLTLKSVMMLKFVTRHCSKVKYIFKSDDDMFIYIPNVFLLIRAIQKKNFKNVLIGQVIRGAKPIHNVKNKWYTPTYMYDESVYPVYLSGTGYIMDRSTAVQLFEAALEIPFFNLEDIFITGLCAGKANIQPRNHLGFSFTKRIFEPCIYAKSKGIITFHRVSLERMRELWEAFGGGTKCPKNVHEVNLDFQAFIRTKTRNISFTRN